MKRNRIVTYGLGSGAWPIDRTTVRHARDAVTEGNSWVAYVATPTPPHLRPAIQEAVEQSGLPAGELRMGGDSGTRLEFTLARLVEWLDQYEEVVHMDQDVGIVAAIRSLDSPRLRSYPLVPMQSEGSTRRASAVTP
jgi:hypothetical protein